MTSYTVYFYYRYYCTFLQSIGVMEQEADQCQAVMQSHGSNIPCVIIVYPHVAKLNVV